MAKYILAKIRIKGKHFETMVDCDKAIALKKGMTNVNIRDALMEAEIFLDVKKGIRVKENELKEIFGTTNIEDIAKKMILDGEVQLPTEYKEKERENKVKQVVDFISANCTDAKGMRHPPQRIEDALKQAHVNIQNISVEEQIPEILKKLQTIIPLKIETKKLIVKVPAIYTGHLYGVLKSYILKEEWLSDGSLSCTVSVPAAAQMAFFDKINSITHGTVITQEIKE